MGNQVLIQAKMKLFAVATTISAVSACLSSPPPPPIDFAPVIRAIEALVVAIEIPTTAAPTTTTTTTTTRAPSACEIKRDELIAANPQNRHIPTCMIADGAFKPDQYDASGNSYCVNVNGDKVEDTIRNAPWIQNGARFDECAQLRL